jgi:hypothetical protein
MRFIAPAFGVALFAAGCLLPTNPFDPDAPAALQAPGQLRGSVQAVITPIDEQSGAVCSLETPAACDGDNSACCVPANSFCAGVDGDHTGFRINLRGLVAENADDAVFAPSSETGPTGEFVFTNVPPGAYALEVVRDGFNVPLPRTVDIGAGADVVLAPLCAIDSTPPPAPVIAGLPEVTRANAADGTAVELSFTIAGCSNGDTVDIEILQDDDVIATARVVPPTADGPEDCVVGPIGGDAPDVRAVWIVRAVASDDVGNLSEPTLKSVLVDVDVPAAPVLDVPVVGLDRVSLSWTQPDGTADIDHWIVSYGLVARPLEAACPSAAHVIDAVAGDEFDVAAFVVEGPSPVTSPIARQTLSGILPGTELFVQVAAVDVAGNVSCFSDPLGARPDRTAPRLQDGVGAAVASQIVVDSDGVTAFGGGVFTVRARDGTLQPVTLDGDPVSVDDVVASGRSFFGAARGLGVVKVTVDAAGVIGAADDIVTGRDVRSLVALPGGLLVGTADGLVVVDRAGAVVASGDPGAVAVPVSRLALRGDLVIAARTDVDGNGLSLQASARTDPTALLGVNARIAGAVDHMVFHGDDLWVIAANVVEVFDTSGCLGLDADCLRSRARFGLADQARATDVADVDDSVVVWSAGAGGGFRFAADFAGVPTVVGRAFPPPDSDLSALRLERQGFGAAGVVDDLGTRGERCWSLVNDGLPIERAPLVGVGAAFAVSAGDGDDVVWLDNVLTDDGPLDLLAHNQGRAIAEHTAPAIVVDDDVALPGGLAGPQDLAHAQNLGTFSVDQYGRLLFLASSTFGDDELTLVDDSAVGDLRTAVATAAPGLLTPLFDDDDDEALVFDDVRLRLDGDDAIVFALARGSADLVTGCPQVFALRLQLAPRGGDGVAVVDVEALSLGRAFRITDAVISGTRAYVGLHPFGTGVVDLTDFSLDAASAIAACDGATNNATLHADAFPLNSLALVGGRVLATGIKGAGFPARDALLDVTTSTHQVVVEAGSRLRAVLAVGPFLGLTAIDPTSAVLITTPVPPASTFLPQAALPGIERAASLAATRTGLVVADGGSGIARFTIR